MNGAKLRISVEAPQALGLEWQKLLPTYVPLSLLAGALLAWAAYRLQQQPPSYREQLRRAMAAGEFHGVPAGVQPGSRAASKGWRR